MGPGHAPPDPRDPDPAGPSRHDRRISARRPLRLALASALALAAGAALPAPAAAAEGECPAFDVFADAGDAGIATKADLVAWAKAPLGARFAEGAPCFVFVSVTSARDASAAYVSTRTSRGGERVVLAETQAITTGAKAFRRNELKKAIREFVSEKAR